MLLKGWLHLEQSNNLQDSEKGETDYSHGGLRINSAYQIYMEKACTVEYRRNERGLI